MRRRMVIVTSAIAVAAVLSSRPVMAQMAGPLHSAIRAAADRQLSLEGAYTNGDTGAGSYACSWEWLVGTGVAYRNTQGPSALGLLAAYAILRNPTYLNGVVCAADQMVGRYDAAPSLRPYADDEILLVTLSDATGNPTYAQKAVAYYGRVQAQFPTGKDLADYYINNRLSLSGWDLSSQILAALAVGQRDYARAIADEIVARRADWETVQYGGYDYTLLSHAALIQALDDVSRRDRPVALYLKEITAAVVAAQDADGAWDEDYQTTAYVIMGLDDADPRPREFQKAEYAGVQYLLNNQTNGGWVYPPEIGEVNGEALTALCLVALPGHDELDWRDFRGPWLHGPHDLDRHYGPHGPAHH